MFNQVQNRKRLWLGLRASNANIDSVRFVLFQRNRIQKQFVEFKLNETRKLVQHNFFNTDFPTVLYIHGFLESLSSESVQTIVDAYLWRNDYNIIVLDWSSLAIGNYFFDAVPNCIQIANYLAEKLFDLKNSNFNVSTLHLVGHSMGAHIAGAAASKFYQKTNKTHKIQRITALDAATFPFAPNLLHHVQEKDAVFVDVIHTDAWVYGSVFGIGTVDFWPNGGRTQPGCPKRTYDQSDDDLQSHQRSWRYWAESVVSIDDNTFCAVKCDSWSDFRKNDHSSSNHSLSVMGINCSVNAKGNYYIQTNKYPPFSKGDDGIYYASIDEFDKKTDL